MKKPTSIHSSILVTVTASLLLLAGIIVFVQTRHEVESLQENTRDLVREQMALTVKKLDVFTLMNQVQFIARTIYELDRVNAVSIYDINCNLLRKQPVNEGISWDCKTKNLPKDLVLYEASNSMSSSSGAPKYVLARMTKIDKNFAWSRAINVLLVTFAAILFAIVGLTILIRRKIINPLNILKGLVEKSGTLTESEVVKSSLPKELLPIYNQVLFRDEIIQNNKDELLKQHEAKVIAEMSQQVAHDIKFPLMVIRDKLLKETAKENNNVYMTALTDLEQLTGLLLEKTDDYQKEIDLNELVSSVIDMKKIEYRHAKKNISFKFTKASDIKYVSINPTKIKFILSNIINNAKDAINPRSRGLIEVTTVCHDGVFSIIIKDNGRGIHKKDFNKIFERGVSIDKPGGNGLGLSDAKDYIEKINGQIKIESQIGKGTTLTLEIPTIEKPSLSTGKAPYDYVLIEDYKMAQMSWFQAAEEKSLNFAVFNSPKEFEKNRRLVPLSATIYLDSRFPDFSQPGEEWAKELATLGYQNIWLSSSEDIDVSQRPYIRGKVDKTKPFSSGIINHSISHSPSNFI